MRKSIYVLLLLSVGSLTACSSTHQEQDPLTTAVAQQAKLVNAQLPVSDAGISLVRADAKGKQLTLNFWQSDKTLDGETFLQHFESSVCQQTVSRVLIQQGARYQLELLTVEKKKLSRPVENCTIAIG